MHEPNFGLSITPAKPPRRGRMVAALLSLLVLAAAAAAAWYSIQQGWLKFDMKPASTATGTATGPAPQTLASATTTAAAVADHAATDAALTSAAARVSALEQRLAELNQQALAASGQATHAEALLLAFAARRAIDRGQPLGYLENQLRVRFGETQPGAVDRVIAAAAKPVTLGALGEDFARLEPRLAGGAANEGGWTWFTRQMGDLFVIRRDDQPSPTAESRIARARAAIAGGQVEAAIAEVERMPGKDAGVEWLARARDWVMTQHSLDQLETTALALPVAAVAPPEPVSTATPAPTASASPTV